ncbi:hypothetical protein ACSBR2_004008 [Camellia fascicularis]
MKNASNYDEFEVFDGLRQWDRASVEVVIANSTFQKWIREVPSCGDDADCGNQEVETGACPQKFRKLLLFSGNDYLGLSSHPTVSKAATQAALAHGMGSRGSALICGYTSYHGLLESCLADLKKKDVLTLFCVLQSIGHWESGSFVHFINLFLHLLTEKINLFFSVV